MDVVKRLYNLVELPLNRLGYDVALIRYSKHRSKYVLEITIYNLNFSSISMDDCVAATKLLSPLLDAYDIFHGRYLLEVMSLGAKKILRNQSDFLDAINSKKVTILSKDRSEYSGIITSVGEMNFVVSTSLNEDISLNYEDVKLVYIKY